MNPRRVSQAGLLIWMGLLAASSSGLRSAEEPPLDDLITRLGSEEVFTREQAEGELRRRGPEILAPLAARLSTPDPARPAPRRELRLEAIFTAQLGAFLAEFEDEILSLAEEREEIQRLQKFIEVRGKDDSPELAEAAERLKGLIQRAGDREPKVQRMTESLHDLLPAGLAAVRKRMEAAPPFVADFYQKLFTEALERQGRQIVIDAGAPDFERRRYLLSSLWLEEVSRRGPLAGEVEPLLDRHLQATFEDLRSPDYLVRERAEDEFYVLGARGLEFLESRRDAQPVICDRLIDLLRWRIHPKVRERTAMDFSNFSKLEFRDRRRHVIQYARCAGPDAIPTLRLVVTDEKREPSIRVRLTAAEALAGLRDFTGIQLLTQRQIPELLKIPEISRDFLILKGEQYLQEKKFDLAILEFQKVLEESPFNFEANYRIAFAYLLSKQFRKAVHHFEVAKRLRPDDQLTLYNLACAYSLDGQIEKALDALEASIRAGFDDQKHIEKDTDLDPLRGEQRYRKIIEGLEAR